MNDRDFVYWLQGFIELDGNPPSPNQWEVIKEHLQLVFNKVTPIVACPPALTPPATADGRKIIAPGPASEDWGKFNPPSDWKDRKYC